MFCSTIIPTIGRSTLARAVLSVLEQNFTAANFEVIVVNDSGSPLSEDYWQESGCVRVINTNCRERSVARNTGAAIAQGEYLHFLDDDDILLPGAMQTFWELAQREKEAVWLYGSWRIADNDGNIVNEFHPELTGKISALLVCGEGLPLQASLLSANAFYQVGAYDPAPILTGVEDRDLGRRLSLFGEIAHTSHLVAQIRIGELGSSTNWKMIAEGDRWGREKALHLPKAFSRIRASITSNYWRGRTSRAYFASMAWNLKRGSIFVAIGRFMEGIVLTGLHIFSPGYWHGLRTKTK